MTYWSQASGRQFVVVVAGGHGSTGTKAGDFIIAYALPKSYVARPVFAIDHIRQAPEL